MSEKLVVEKDRIAARIDELAEAIENGEPLTKEELMEVLFDMVDFAVASMEEEVEEAEENDT